MISKWKNSDPLGSSLSFEIDRSDPRLKVLRGCMQDNAYTYFTDYSNSYVSCYRVPKGKRFVILGTTFSVYNVSDSFPEVQPNLMILSSFGYTTDGGALDYPAVEGRPTIFYDDLSGFDPVVTSSPLIIRPEFNKPMAMSSSFYYAEIPLDMYPFAYNGNYVFYDSPDTFLAIEIIGMEIDV